MREFVKDGTIEGFELWDPGKLGYLAGYAAAALVLRADHRRRGREVQGRRPRRDGRSAPSGEVILGPPTVFDKNNIDDFDF